MLSHIEIQKALAYAKLKKYHRKPFYRKFSTEISRLSMFCCFCNIDYEGNTEIQIKEDNSIHKWSTCKNLGKYLTFSCIKNKRNNLTARSPTIKIHVFLLKIIDSYHCFGIYHH